MKIKDTYKIQNWVKKYFSYDWEDIERILGEDTANAIIILHYNSNDTENITKQELIDCVNNGIDWEGTIESLVEFLIKENTINN